MKVEKTIKISASPEKIWPFLIDPTKIVLWFDSFKKCEYTSETHSGVGATYYVEEKVPGSLRKINFEAVIWNENKRLTLRMTSGVNVKNYEIQWKIEADKSGTIFYFVEDVGMPFGIIGKVLGVLGQRTAEKMVEGMLMKLKKLSEAQGSSI
ncbi:SRPBCC family protein [Desulfobacula sp.]|uniref:SRPBCC family protein n=1 Tax=Desulfobacula sp. TaxID=2593537 RepID=UPI0025BE9158|nr:SRPBCC family protein [Desulfobacula sp.]MBC2704410.1 SRPBCC family protein [Desulfobacula sp.]